MKYWIQTLMVCIVVVGCTKDCNNSVAEQKEKWLSSQPTSFAYTVTKSFFGPLEAQGPYRFHVIDGQIDTIYYDIEHIEVDTNFLFVGWDDYETVKEYAVGFDIDAVFSIVAGTEGECSVTYDPDYHFPTEFIIPSEPEIPDSGSSLRVSDFEEL